MKRLLTCLAALCLAAPGEGMPDEPVALKWAHNK